MLFWKKETQLDRIKNKLGKAMRKDTAFSVFGASSHKYRVYEKLTAKELADWQAKNQVTLPEPYTQFLTRVGNGGAGPYYGIYSIEKATSYTDSALTTKCVIHPGMTKEEWNHLTEPLINDEDISDLEYDAARDRVLGGMLCIGTQGCEYDMYLVIEGKHRGKIVYTSDFYPDRPFFFVYEDNFLDWYERWLDEIILDYDIAWFGSRMPGDENALIQVYQNAPNEEIKSKALDGMFKFKKISQPTIDFLESVAEQRQNDRTTAIQLICKTSVDAGRGYLLELLHSDRNEDLLHALQILNWYGKSFDLAEFIKVIVQSLDRVHDPETLRHVGYVLESSGAITLQNFAPFLCHTDSNIQTAAIYATRDCNDKSESWEIIQRMFMGGGKEAVKNSIQYWGLIPHEKLLPYYKAAWPEYKSNPNFREKFMACLKELNLPDDYFDKE
ncbi:SMI1/KNR4 family protein [Paenibacillus chitinolyticus]|uniref:SMI1/KNR4 family protein n=1 Tax=Paenibacillus chitinolyticus TaxID=79263 RepID=UPI001C45E72C|nr:SMI1/KNR4 family protein [Paenibacillus chitinolyticus]MBV6713946.1 SMI1/KNR4 family protein [Paenibacillus chitinolyticus]